MATALDLINDLRIKHGSLPIQKTEELYNENEYTNLWK